MIRSAAAIREVADDWIAAQRRYGGASRLLLGRGSKEVEQPNGSSLSAAALTDKI